MISGRDPAAWRAKRLIPALVVAGIASVLLLVHGTGGSSTVHTESVKLFSIADVAPAQWRRLSETTIYFGHQSVGFNILDGVRDIMKDDVRIRLSLVETDDPERLAASVFAHSAIGTNRDPRSKIDAFAAAMEKGIADKAGIAFFKLCYVDVNEETDVEAVFAHYRSTMARLRAAYPRTVFVHVTVPLTSMETGVKPWIKDIIGRPVRGYEDNMARTRLNEMLKKEFDGKEPVFDLAGIEATLPDGSRTTYEKGGRSFQALVRAYTDNGGHLNETGRKVVAEQLLVFLANLMK